MNPYTINKTPTTVLLEIAERHKALRKATKLSQSELAVRAGISLGSLKRFEQTGQIALESLLKLVHVLDRLGDFYTIMRIDQALIDAERLFSNKTRRS